MGRLARSNPTRTISSSRNAISNAGSFTARYAPLFQFEIWIIGKPGSIRRHAVTNRCDVFSSASNRNLMCRLRPVVALSSPRGTPWQMPAHSAPVLASSGSGPRLQRSSSHGCRRPTPPKPRSGAQAHRPHARPPNHEIQFLDTPPPGPSPSDRDCREWRHPDVAGSPGEQAKPPSPPRFGRTARWSAKRGACLRCKRSQVYPRSHAASRPTTINHPAYPPSSATPEPVDRPRRGGRCRRF